MCVHSGFLPETMRKDKQQQQEPKGKYRVTNWPAYNAGLIARVDVTIWMEQDLWQRGPEVGAVKRGRPCVYANAVIQMLLGLKQVFRLPLRALQGFAGSMNKLAFPDLPVPNYTTLCRRAHNLNVVLPVTRSGEPLHLVVDSTGLKVFGEGVRIPRKLDTCSAANWTVVPAQTGHLFQAKLDTCSRPNWTPWAGRRGVEVWFYSGRGELVKLARFFRSESPFKLSWWALWTKRSRMASAKVASPMAACQCSIGSWLVTMVERLPWRSSSTSSRSRR
jgi:hypothetical protein